MFKNSKAKVRLLSKVAYPRSSLCAANIAKRVTLAAVQDSRKLERCWSSGLEYTVHEKG